MVTVQSAARRAHSRSASTTIFHCACGAAAGLSYPVNTRTIGAPRSCAILGEVGDVPDLHLALRNIAVLQVGGEVGVPGDAGAGDPALLQSLTELPPRVRIPVEHGEMRPLGHQHHAVVPQGGGLVDELLNGEEVLSPRSGIADRV